MFVIITGGGRTGSYLASNLLSAGHKVTVVEKRRETYEKIKKEISTEIILGDGSNPTLLQEAGTRKANLVIAVTSQDEDNLVIARLAKLEFNVPRVIARVNHPKNYKIFTREWGVDVAISATHIIAKLIEEEATIGDLVTLLKLRSGEIALVEAKIDAGSTLIGKEIRGLELPPDAVVVSIIRDEKVVFPKGQSIFTEGDEVLILTSVASEKRLSELFRGSQG
ncbi:MAG: TrkA family potassium uptake protein [Nitrospirae bacterium]|nr:TrkA family potassium uptake protein [Nitrospirota bacterium]